jgi:hypothetical protein
MIHAPFFIDIKLVSLKIFNANYLGVFTLRFLAVIRKLCFKRRFIFFNFLNYINLISQKQAKENYHFF